MNSEDGMGHSIEKKNGGYYVGGSRVSLDSIVYLYQDGASAETIRDDFPSLSLEQIWNAIDFYLTHREDVDANIREGEARIKQLVPSLRSSRPELFAKLQRAKLGLKR